MNVEPSPDQLKWKGILNFG